ncbi:enoyl-CoA hydratase/isomerase family protein [Kineosporia sp. J2-2]|uniref:3-hydroxyisobutyryl-CoA hydrolase n=1 Tax=Kineosporia corallincola TaxID=2835133 RepID=A0ABS5TKT3_9ACTN|nr:enoyl-CoA hydratase/isomerase family protein [Kineosporia corallincola]MBT0771706.1 enoyl-CoA hydratase/isomerase family protein [Kineosporia corallincola]
MATSGTFVRIGVQDRVGRITLTRPQAINALDHDMTRAVDTALRAWRDDGRVECVIMDGEGPRGFCAGGDVKAMGASAASDGGTAVRAFWSDEYRLNALLDEYPKPVVTLLHGITFGGGVGLGCHAAHRVVTGDTRIAMPETVIGLVPDVGGAWLLSHAPGELGTYLALSGLPVGPADALLCGLADVHTPVETFAELAAATSWKAVENLLATRATAPPPGRLERDRAWIDRCFTGDDVAGIVARLEADPEPAAREAAGVLLSRSPTSLCITLTALRNCARMPGLRAGLVQDYRTVSHSLGRPDLLEGIRAQLVDKDRAPRWRPSRLEDVDPAVVARHFTPAPGGDLTFA